MITNNLEQLKPVFNCSILSLLPKFAEILLQQISKTNTMFEASEQLLVVKASDLKQGIEETMYNAIETYFAKPKEEKLLTASQVATILEVTKPTLWRWDKEGYLKKVMIGGKPRYKESEVMAIREGRQ